MRFPRRPPLAVAAVLAGATVFAAAACGPPPAPPSPNGGPTAEPGCTTAPTTEPTASATTTTPTGSATVEPGLVCKLPSPKKSNDACHTDADCGVSDPCHAHACVAVASSHPPDKSTICTRLMDCMSADANACACFEGVCALVPRD